MKLHRDEVDTFELTSAHSFVYVDDFDDWSEVFNTLPAESTASDRFGNPVDLSDLDEFEQSALADPYRRAAAINSWCSRNY